MPVLSFRSPVLKPLLRKGTPKPVPPDPRAYDTFRVTQQFADTDFYYKDGRLHSATDIGNFTCGDPIVAMASGIAYHAKDSAGALGVKIDHGHGIWSEYWHLDRIDTYNGQPVNTGFQIGTVGRTGLGNVCHTHIEVKRNGTRIDPEPLMFGGFLVTSEDEDVKIAGTFERHIQNRKAVLTVDAHIRAGVVAGEDTSLEVLKAGTVLYPIVSVKGRIVGTSSIWLGCIAYVGGSWNLGYVHSSVLSEPEPIESLGGYSADDLEEAKRLVRANAVAIQTQGVSALRNLALQATAGADALAAKKP